MGRISRRPTPGRRRPGATRESPQFATLRCGVAAGSRRPDDDESGGPYTLATGPGLSGASAWQQVLWQLAPACPVGPSIRISHVHVSRGSTLH